MLYIHVYNDVLRYEDILQLCGQLNKRDKEMSMDKTKTSRGKKIIRKWKIQSIDITCQAKNKHLHITVPWKPNIRGYERLERRNL